MDAKGTGNNVFCDHTIKLHRNLMAFSSATLAIIIFGIEVTEANVFGIKIGKVEEWSFHLALGGIVAYHLISFLLNASVDVGRGWGIFIQTIRRESGMAPRYSPLDKIWPVVVAFLRLQFDFIFALILGVWAVVMVFISIST